MKYRLPGVNDVPPHCSELSLCQESMTCLRIVANLACVVSCREPSLSSSVGTTVPKSSEERGQGHDEELALARHWN